MLSAEWVSSDDDCMPFFTCFAPNVVKSSWRADHLAQGETMKQMMKSLFAGHSEIVTLVDISEVFEINPTNWADSVTVTSAAPDMDVASDIGEEDTLICHQCGAEHIAPFDLALHI